MGLRMTCKNCDWQGDQQEIIWNDRGLAMCPKCHQEVVFIQELRDIRIEEKLDKIIALLVTMVVEKAIEKGDELVWFCPDCKKHNEVGTPCSDCGKPTIEEINNFKTLYPEPISEYDQWRFDKAEKDGTDVIL